MSAISTDNSAESANPRLHEVLAYRNKDVVDAFVEQYDVSEDEAEIIFVEMLRFLWLCESSSSHLLRVIDDPILVIDEMWHTFILFTRDYHSFCQRFFGHYMHHSPTTVREKKEAAENLTPEKKRKHIEDKRLRYNMIYDILGRDVFITWYHDFPEWYSKERLRDLRKQ